MRYLTLTNIAVVALLACHDRRSVPLADAEKTCAAEKCGAESTWASLASIDAEVACITSDDANVYWITTAGSVGSLSKTAEPGAATPMRSTASIDTGAVPRCNLALAGEWIYAPLFNRGAILRISRDGTRGSTFGKLSTPSSILIDGDVAYATETETGQIVRVPLPSDVDAGDAGDAGTAEKNPVVLGRASLGAHDLVLVGDTLFWLDEGGVRQMPKAGGTTTLRVPAPGNALTYANGMLYWIATNHDDEGRNLWTLNLVDGSSNLVSTSAHAWALSTASSAAFGIARGRLFKLEQGKLSTVFSFDRFAFSTEPPPADVDLDFDPSPTAPTTLRHLSTDAARFLTIDDKGEVRRMLR